MASTIQNVGVTNLVKTPIGAALDQVANDLAGVKGPKIIVLVTDGEETCGGDPATSIKRLTAQGFDVQVNIVGVALDGDLRAGGAALTNPGALADATTEVIQLRAAHIAAGGNLDALDLRRVQRERPLHAHAEGLLAHGEGLSGAMALALDDDALEHLGPAAAALDDLEMHAHPVTGLEVGDAAQLRALEAFDDRAHGREKAPGA